MIFKKRYHNNILNMPKRDKMGKLLKLKRRDVKVAVKWIVTMWVPLKHLVFIRLSECLRNSEPSRISIIYEVSVLSTFSGLLRL